MARSSEPRCCRRHATEVAVTTEAKDGKEMATAIKVEGAAKKKTMADK